MVAEATVVIDSVLQDVGKMPSVAGDEIQANRLNEVTDRLGDAASSAWELSRLLGESGAKADADAGDHLSKVERALQAAQRLIAEYEPRVEQIRHRTGELEAKVGWWIEYGPIVVSLVSAWIALSQVAVLAWGWSWWRS